jgi:3-deoxy-manno-octulosonate cytidylyltransferase (CMP-KDO synthetase)
MSAPALIVIPARLSSTRLPEKLLLRAGGKSVLQHTHDAASRATVTDRVVVAVDDKKLADEVQSFGGTWIMTRPDCASGTDRIAEVARSMPQVDLFVNVQGDEPEIDPATIDLVAGALIEHPDADMATIGTPIRDRQTLADPSCVKIVMTGQGRAIYFSRAAVPHSRETLSDASLAGEPPLHWHHVGLYAYRRQFLEWFSGQRASPLEELERLEQLRAIEAGKKIVVARVESATPGIDTQEDFRAFEKRIARPPR